MIDLTIKDADRVQGLLQVQAALVQKLTDSEIINAALKRLLAEAQKPEERVTRIPEVKEKPDGTVVSEKG